MRGMWVAVAVLGFASMLVQLTLLREFLNLFYGNELVFGLILGCWLLLVGAGSYVGGRVDVANKKSVFAQSLILSSALLPATVYLSRTVGCYITVRGEMASLPQILLAAVVTLAAYCVLYGLQITLACGILAEENRKGVGLGYTLDSLGNVFGGIAFSFILVNLFDSFQVAYVAAAANLAAVFLLSKEYRVPAVLFAILLMLFASTVDLQGITNRVQYGGQNILEQRNTRYGNLVVTESSGQVNFFENSVPLFSTHETIAAEETVHYAMVQEDNPENVLLVGGGMSGTLNEILKYNVSRVDYVELDPAIIQLAREYVKGSGLEDGRVNVVNTDGRLFVKSTPLRYDVVIVDLPDPTTAQLNRFYTIEFFKEVRGILKTGGVFSTSMSSSENYMNEEIRRLNAGLYRTMKDVFKNVIVLPGGRNIYVASDSKLSYDIPSLVKKSGVRTEYVNEYYLGGVLTQDRIGYLLNAISAGGVVNRDFKPMGYYQHLRYWMTYFNIDPAYILAALILLSAAVYMRLKPIAAGVLAVGFTGTALEMTMLISFQALHGFVYHQVGVIVTSFMVGLTAAAYYANNRLRKNTTEFRLIVLGAGAYSLLLPAVLAALNTHPTLTQLSAQLLFPLLAAVLGGLVGMLFPVAAAIVSSGKTPSETAGSLYGLDFLGAFFGSVLVSVFLIPSMGIINVCVLTAVINLVVWWRLRNG